MNTPNMTIVLSETGTMTAAVLEVARVMRAITRSRENIGRSQLEIGSTTKRLMAHLARFAAARKAQGRHLAAQQKELRRQLLRLRPLKGSKR